MANVAVLKLRLCNRERANLSVDSAPDIGETASANAREAASNH